MKLQAETDQVMDVIRDKIFGNTSVSLEDNIEALGCIREEVGAMIQTLEADLENLDRLTP
jgi:hypothetical protein